ncbi:CBASS cGAMP-activated phospholipase [Robertmurraya sp. DFI.2.37]|uniref:CBASS cGAMP-activated phospholipase n=1 Tax=Robertmurraya sp. DFI.2.37 TaxID=3031819 RepID=UPI0023DBDD5A|nr:CBASS cGAMP-activated phospholipase [Robertmurraya sp. DFI.2.37]MDF1510330.1 CBASS cGAMP-activated phospholipase [Robertmurraya sp. DFI.2.37]
MKVLCIDGGGIRGVFAVAILDEIEKELGKPIGEAFDLIAGTSTGAIVAASVALNKKMSEVLDYYKRYAEKIFLRQAKVGFFKTVYSDRYMRRFFQKAFGDYCLADIEKPLLIPAVDLTNGRPYIHRTNFGHAPNENDLSIKLWDAVLSSCSAPLYFPPNNMEGKFLSIDGGLWANNPSLVCLTEAMQQFEENFENVTIVSIGTGKQKIDFSNKTDQDWGARQWLPLQIPSLKVTPKLLDLALHLSSESITYHCEQLLKGNYIRVNEDLGREIPFDEVKYIDDMVNLAKVCLRREQDNILQAISVEK